MKNCIKLMVFFLVLGFNSASAKWITNSKVKNTPNSWVMFKKSFELDKKDKDYLLEIAVDSKYWLWLNDELVVFEGGLKRGPNYHDTYFDKIDLSEKLKKGENTISILVWYFGKHGFSHKSSGQLGLYADLFEGGDLLMNTDASWKTKVHPSYIHSTEGEQPNYRLPEWNIIYDARNEVEDWYKADVDAQLESVEVVGDKGVAPWNSLHYRIIPQWKDYGLKKYEQSRSFSFVSDGKPIVCKLPYNCQMTPYFKIKAKAGLKVDLRTEDYHGGGPANVRAEYTTKEGVQDYENKGWMNGHEMIYTFPKGVEVLDLQFRETGYNTEFSGEFKCNDEYYNKLWEKAMRTLYVTMRDNFMDCPDRERAQWWGDAVNEIGECFYALSTSSHLLAKKAILELMNWQRPDGTIFSPIPAGNYNSELPMQMLNSVGFYGMYNYYLNTGDLETVRKVFPKIKKYLEVWKIKENGLITERKGGWTWGDWGANKDMSILYNCWYQLACKGYALMADALNEPWEAKWARENMEIISKNFNKTYWTGKEYKSPNYKGKTDDRANAMAVLAGFAIKEQFPAIYKVLQDQHHSSPYMEKYVDEALFQMGYPEYAMKRMKLRYKKMVESHLTTLWEGWGIGSEGFGGGSYNHAWSGGPLTLFNQYLVGVTPSKVAYDEISIKPQMANIKHAKAKFESVKGDISIENTVNEDKFEQNIKTPDTVAIKVYKPNNKKVLSLEINGSKSDKLKELNKNGFIKLDGGSYIINFLYK